MAKETPIDMERAAISETYSFMHLIDIYREKTSERVADWQAPGLDAYGIAIMGAAVTLGKSISEDPNYKVIQDRRFAFFDRSRELASQGELDLGDPSFPDRVNRLAISETAGLIGKIDIYLGDTEYRLTNWPTSWLDNYTRATEDFLATRQEFSPENHLPLASRLKQFGRKITERHLEEFGMEVV